MKLFYSLLVTLFTISPLCAQLFEPASSVPPGTDWQQINTDTVRLVFPKGLEDQANRIVNMVHYQAANNLASIGNRFRKTDIFLLNETVISNGYVTVAPYHSKFYTNFPQRSFYGSMDWLDILAIHEYRHALQFSNTLNGITKLAYFLTGEMLWGSAFSLAVPPWFFEGDAVMQETTLSFSGRGRMKSFSAELRTIGSLKKPFGYEKMVNGSFKDMIPNHYVLGYDLVKFGRSEFGNEIWKDVFKDATAYKGGLYPFSRALKKRTGMRTPKFYRNMIQNAPIPEFTELLYPRFSTSFEKSDPASYSLPRFQGNNRLFAVKESFNQAAKIIRIDLKNGNETPVVPVGFGMGEYDVNDQLLVWSEITLDPRWSDRSYSNIWKHDLSTGITTQLTEKSKLFAPVISPDGNRILVIEVDQMMKNSLIILDASTGKQLEKISPPEAFNFRYPVWQGNDQVILVAQKNNRNAIIRVDLNSGKHRELVPFSIASFEDLSISDGKLFFLANEGMDKALNDVMVYYLNTGKLYVLDFKMPFLTEMPQAGPNGQIAFISTEFNQKRIHVLTQQVEKPFAGFNKNPNLITERQDEALHTLTLSENGPIVERIPQKQYPVKNYIPGLSKLTLHSWILTPGSNDISLVLAANDKLGHYGVQWSPGYNYRENVLKSDISMTLGNWFPLFTIGHNTLINRTRLPGNETGGDTLSWNESRIYGKVSVPLAYIRRNYSFGFNPQLGYGMSMISANNPLDKNEFHTAFVQLQGSAIRKKAYRSIKAPYSYTTDWTFSKTLNNKDKVNISGNVNVYLPGIRPTHFIQLIAEYRYTDLQNEYHPLNDSYTVRGFNSGYLSDHNLIPKVNYGFPVWYPDIALGPFVYFKRIRANLFYDIGLEWDLTQEDPFRQVHSTGIELLFDNRYFRLIDLSAGVRAGYKPVRHIDDAQKFFIEMVFDVN